MKKLLLASLDRPVKASIYSLKTGQVREVDLTPSEHWGGQGLLGVSIRYVALVVFTLGYITYILLQCCVALETNTMKEFLCKHSITLCYYNPFIPLCHLLILVLPTCSISCSFPLSTENRTFQAIASWVCFSTYPPIIFHHAVSLI